MRCIEWIEVSAGTAGIRRTAIAFLMHMKAMFRSRRKAIQLNTQDRTVARLEYRSDSGNAAAGARLKLGGRDGLTTAQRGATRAGYRQNQQRKDPHQHDCSPKIMKQKIAQGLAACAR
jgi:hypothetical protein